MKILAIDPGNKESGWCIYDGHKVLECGITENENFLNSHIYFEADLMAIEMVSSYGMPVGREVFETVLWIGKFIQDWIIKTGKEPKLIYRKDIKMHFCESMRAKDANIRQALIDLFPATGGGKTPQIGTKAQPGPLYGVSSHIWSALAVAVMASDDSLV